MFCNGVFPCVWDNPTAENAAEGYSTVKLVSLVSKLPLGSDSTLGTVGYHFKRDVSLKRKALSPVDRKDLARTTNTSYLYQMPLKILNILCSFLSVSIIPDTMHSILDSIQRIDL